MREIAPATRFERVYEPAEPGDGTRILVDRLWPRGLSREAAPSHELRRW